MKPFTIEECDLAPGYLSEAEAEMKLLSLSEETDLPNPSEIVTKAKEERSILPHPPPCTFLMAALCLLIPR